MESLKRILFVISFFVFNKTFAYSISSSLGTSICYGQTTTLNLLGSDGQIFNGGNSITWYKMAPNDSNECTPEPFLANGNSLNVTVTGKITIWCKPACGVSNTGALVSITLNVKSSPTVPTISANGNILTSSSATGNQWYNQNGIINGATNQDYTPTLSGNYYVTTSSGGCSSTSATFNYASLSNPTFDINNGIKVYPNPTSSNITIDLGSNSVDRTYQIKITNTLGQLIYTGKLDKQQSTIELKQHATSGIYLISILNDFGTVLSANKIILN